MREGSKREGIHERLMKMSREVGEREELVKELEVTEERVREGERVKEQLLKSVREIFLGMERDRCRLERELEEEKNGAEGRDREKDREIEQLKKLLYLLQVEEEKEEREEG